MARYINVHTAKQSLGTITAAQRESLSSFLTREIDDAISSRAANEALWRNLLRQYEGVPKNPVRNTPVENAPNIEVTLGAIAADALYAQIIDLIYASTPLITCRPMPKDKDDQETIAAVKALQRFINWVAENEAKIRASSDDAILDDVQLGTGVLYIPWAEQRKKTRTATVLSQGPRVRSIPLEDFIIPGGSYSDLDELHICAIRFWLTEEEVNIRAARNRWNIEHITPAGAKDWVRTRRELLGKQFEGVERKAKLYEILDVYCQYDIDGDGINEDLYVVFDRTSRSVLFVDYAPYDRLPIETFVYQRRAHLALGLGVLQMISPYQEELSDLHNYQTLNALLANCRLWKGRTGRVPSNMLIWPNRVIELMDPESDLVGVALADTYQSLPQIQATVIQLAERRVGLNAMTAPMGGGMMGNRTPGITAISMLQQINKRFTPAFDAVRAAIAAALRQCLYRYQEQLLAGKTRVMTHITSILGVEDGWRVIRLLRDQSFDEHVTVELTTASASINKEADRQNAMLLVNILSQYYQRVLELVAIASDPKTPPPIQKVAQKIANSAGEIIDRTIRTFDQVRDPATFIIEVDEAIEEASAGGPQQAVTELLSLFGGAESPAVEPLG